MPNKAIGWGVGFYENAQTVGFPDDGAFAGVIPAAYGHPGGGQAICVYLHLRRDVPPQDGRQRLHLPPAPGLGAGSGRGNDEGERRLLPGEGLHP